MTRLMIADITEPTLAAARQWLAIQDADQAADFEWPECAKPVLEHYGDQSFGEISESIIRAKAKFRMTSELYQQCPSRLKGLYRSRAAQIKRKGSASDETDSLIESEEILWFNTVTARYPELTDLEHMEVAKACFRTLRQ